jgi:hypothetical protein
MEAARRPRRKSSTLFYVAMAFLLPATLLGISRHGEGLLPKAQYLFAPGGAVLVLYGALVSAGRARWMGEGAERPQRVGAILGMLGLAALGVGLAEITGVMTFHLLTIPAIVSLGLLSLREAWHGKRGWMYRHLTPTRPWWSIRAGLWMFGLMWPLLVAWAVGAADLS